MSSPSDGLTAQLAEHGHGARLPQITRTDITLAACSRMASPSKRERQQTAEGLCISALPGCGITPAIIRSEKDQAAMKQPPEPDAHPLAGPRPPDYVIVTWVSEQLRDRIQRNNAALTRDRQDPGRQRHGRRAEPEAELEAEP